MTYTYPQGKYQIADEIGRLQRFSAFGDPIFVQETFEVGGKLVNHWPTRQFTQYELGGCYSDSYNGNFRFHAGSAIGMSVLMTRVGAPYTPSFGKTAKISFAFDPQTSDPYNTQGFGLGDYLTLNGVFVTLTNGILSFSLYRAGTLVITHTSNNWTIPVTIDNKNHLFYIEAEFMGVGNFYLRMDGKIVDTITYLGLYSDPSFTIPDSRMMAFILNTGAPARDYNPRVTVMGILTQGQSSNAPVDTFFAANESAIALTSGSFTPILTIQSAPNNFGVQNTRPMIIKSIEASASKAITAYRITRNSIMTGTWKSAEVPNDPTLAPVATQTAVLASASGYTPGGTGYANTNTVQYGYSALGTMWATTKSESGISPASNTLTMTGVYQNTVAFAPIAYAYAHQIYRKVNGGAWVEIATLPSWALNVDATGMFQFTDNAFPVLGPGKVPAATNAEGDSFVNKMEGGARNATPGQILRLTDASQQILNLNDMPITLNPGESITIECQAASTGTTGQAKITWEEDAL